MRNTVLENQIQSDLFKAADSFRGYVKNYEIFPIFILLKRLNKDFDKIVSLRDKQSNHEVYRQLYRSLPGNDPTLSEAFSVFEDTFASHIYVHWPSYFQKFPIDTLSQEEFEIYFEQSLILSRKKDSYSDYSTPKEIAEFITSVYSVKENAKVFNPFGGNASLANYFQCNIRYSGNEINRKAWALGILNLAAHNRLENSDFLCKDYFYDSRKESPYDLVISNLPFGLRSPGSNYIIPNEVDGNTMYFAIRQIAPKGKAVFLTTTSFLSNSNRNAKELRKDLIDRDILEYIVLLPSKLFSNTAIPSVAIFLNTSPDKKHGVTFIDASEFLLSAGKKDKILDSGRLLELISEEGDTEFKRWVAHKEIVDQDYNFNVRRYLLDDDSIVSEYKIVTLGQIAEERPRERSIDPGTVGKFIRIRDLKSEILEHNIDLKEIEVNEIPTHAYEVKYASLLLALRFKTLKPTLIGFSGEKNSVYISNDILSLKVDDNIVDAAYLISELNSDFVLKQVKSYQYGANIPSLRKKDVLNLKIRLPEKDIQRKLFQEKLEAVYKEKDSELKAFKSQYNVKGEAFKELASLKHSLGRPLLNIGSGILTMEAYLEKITDSALRIELKNILDSINDNISLANNLLERNENELNLESYKFEEIELVSFLKKYIASNSSFSFKTKLSVSEEIINEFEDEIFVNSNTDLLTVLLNNIFDNADRHAFKGQKSEANELLVRLDIDTDQEVSKAILSFKNNGLPFPENFDKEKFIRKNLKAGETGNTGIGGYDIYRIVNFMQGSFDLKLNEDDQYATVYEIELPVIITKEDNDENI
jgi:type I restriction enzyme M protein